MPVFTLAKYLCTKASTPFFRNMLKKKYSGKTLDLKLYKSTRNFFKIFYFAFITCFGFYVYKDTNYHSPLMFGSGDIMYLVSDWPYNVMPRYLKLYYMIGLSYHLEVTVVHFFQTMQNDFFEMLLHHYITILLIVGSYMTGWWSVGINVMIQMDNGDCFGGMMKAFMDFAPIPFVLINYLLLLYSWIYFRVIIFGYEVFWKGSMFGQFHIDGSGNLQTIYQMLLLGLLVLNVYWTILFFRMGYRFATKGEVKDIQNPVEDKKGTPPKQRLVKDKCLASDKSE